MAKSQDSILIFGFRDPTLPPFFVIKNCVLIASALDNWHDANVWRLSAEQTYVTTLHNAQRKHDEEALAVLVGIRQELDELATFRHEDLSGLNHEEMEEMIEEDMKFEALQEALLEQDMEDTAGIDFEDDEAVAKAEAEILLPIRASDTDHAASPINQATRDHPSAQKTKKTLSKKKSMKFSKGGAYHAQHFSKSRPEIEPRGSVVDWTLEDSKKK